jgi:predicted NBD/HSP70 family sugar kinase
MAFLGIEIGGTKLQVAVVSATGVVTATARGSVAAASGAADGAVTLPRPNPATKAIPEAAAIGQTPAQSPPTRGAFIG